MSQPFELEKLKIIEKPLVGWQLDKVRRFKQHDHLWYEVHLIRTVDGASVYGINDSFAGAWYEARDRARAKTDD